MIYINTTPHSINLQGVGEIPPSDLQLRLEETITVVNEKPTRIVKIGYKLGDTDQVVSAIKGGQIVIASAMYCEQFIKWHTLPIYSPAELIRDDAGRVIGCKSLTQWCNESTKTTFFGTHEERLALPEPFYEPLLPEFIDAVKQGRFSFATWEVDKWLLQSLQDSIRLSNSRAHIHFRPSDVHPMYAAFLCSVIREWLTRKGIWWAVIQSHVHIVEPTSKFQYIFNEGSELHKHQRAALLILESKDQAREVSK